MANSYTENRQNRLLDQQEDLKIVSLPWAPGLSPKLRKLFRKAGYKTVFKSGSNLNHIDIKKQDEITTSQSSRCI